MARWTAPFRERNGRFSVLKSAVLAGLCAPAAWLSYLYLDGDLFPKPVTELIHGAGDWSLRFLVLSLAITPLRQTARWNRALVVRRMVGVAAFAYAFAHFALYVVDQKFQLDVVASEIALRFYLTIGFVALVGLGALAATSTDGMIKKLGAPAWNRLHRTVYALSLIGLWHYFIQAKLDVSRPVFLGGLLAVFLLYRLGRKAGGSAAAAAYGSLAIAPFVAMLAEALWYRFLRHIDFWSVLCRNWDLSGGLSSGLWLICVCAAAAALLILRDRPPGRASAVLSAAE